MKQQFVDREEELAFLERKYREGGAQLIVIYGKRRVGKTELIRKFMEGKRGAYYMCTRTTIAENIRSLSAGIADATGKAYFRDLSAGSFLDLLRHLSAEIGKRRFVLAIDEFPYLVELDKGIPSEFQKAWDEFLSETNIYLILCGSSIGMMENEVLSSKSPLYGRRTGQWKVRPMGFPHLREFFPSYTAEELAKAWAVAGGTPFYLSKFDPSRSVEWNIREKMMRKGEVLYEEPMILLREEFRKPRVYALMLKYLSLGYNTTGKLMSATGLDKGNISKYLFSLEEVGIIRHVLPVGKRKRGIYEISDNFFDFWFRFVYPNMSDLEMGNAGGVMKRLKKELNSHFGRSFERLARELIASGGISLPFRPANTGRWWHGESEIDIVAGDDKNIAFGEVKWKAGADARRIVAKLADVSESSGLAKGRKKHFIVVAKSFRRRISEFEGTPVVCVSLDEMAKSK